MLQVSVEELEQSFWEKQTLANVKSCNCSSTPHNSSCQGLQDPQTQEKLYKKIKKMNKISSQLHLGPWNAFLEKYKRFSQMPKFNSFSK